jgi:hypothetical protein
MEWSVPATVEWKRTIWIADAHRAAMESVLLCTPMNVDGVS